MRLKAGTKATVIPSATEDNYSASMAEAMEAAFNSEWKNVMGDATKPQPSDQMQLLFISIARGIVKHLYDNHEAFTVKVDPNTGYGTVNGIVTEPIPPLPASLT